jgi:hypothetical protein
MRKLFKFISSPIVLILIIYSLLAQGLFLKGAFEVYRFSEKNYNIYKYSPLISKGLVYIAFIVSFLYPLIIWLKTKELKKHLVLIFIGFLPALYFLILYALSNFF